MARTQDEQDHADAVDAWLARSIDHGSSVEIVDLFRVAFEALWTRAVTTLGSVTLTAIAERVLATATGQYAFLSAINPRPNGDARWKQQLQDRLALVPRSELIEGLRFGLIELVTVIGRLTAEILSEELHAALMEATASTRDASTPKTGTPGASTATDPHGAPAAIATKVLP